MAYYKTQDGKGWYGFRPNDIEGLIEVSEQEWLEHIKETHKLKNKEE